MLLVIDVGNTNTVIGIYDGETLKHDWRIRTIRDSTADEFNVLVNALFSDQGVNRKNIVETIISSVVPSSVQILDTFCKKKCNAAEQNSEKKIY